MDCILLTSQLERSHRILHAVLYEALIAGIHPLDCSAQELNNLKGWKQAVSLILEALDFATPLILQIGKKGSEALSWLLVALIGRSLGLIFKGIKQSLGFKRERNSANAKKEASSVML